jgi:hypothetical protein
MEPAHGPARGSRARLLARWRAWWRRRRVHRIAPFIIGTDVGAPSFTLDDERRRESFDAVDVRPSRPIEWR